MTELPLNWRETLSLSVSPLGGGARELRVRGWQPADGRAVRPGRTAAVLVGITDEHDPQVLLTRRARHLAKHAGQVSFPGGAAMDSDLSGVVTALREAEEEIGLRQANVQPLGFLDRIDTFTDFRVLPVVGLVRQPGPFVPDPAEVDEVFTLPLAHALDVRAWQGREVERMGRRYTIHSMEWQGHQVWGVTAAILLNLAHRVQACAGAGQAPLVRARQAGP